MRMSKKEFENFNPVKEAERMEAEDRNQECLTLEEMLNSGMVHLVNEKQLIEVLRNC